MSEKTAVRTREKWVDGVKVIACMKAQEKVGIKALKWLQEIIFSLCR